VETDGIVDCVVENQPCTSVFARGAGSWRVQVRLLCSHRYVPLRIAFAIVGVLSASP
jgi:hypothetical protein